MSKPVKERELTCIICPRGCSLRVTVLDDGTVSVTGNSCPRGKTYGETEMTHPMRTLTTTVATADGRMLPVRTSAPVPKEMLFACMEAVNEIVVSRDTDIGDILVPDLLGTGADLIATGSWKSRT